MFIIFGHYNFSKKRHSYKNGYCHSCKRPATILRFRCFRFGHIFWIPVLPLGFRYSSHCALCGDDPRDPGTSQLSLMAGAVVFFLLFFLTWMIPTTDIGEFTPVVWGMRAITGVITALMLLAFFRKKRKRAAEPPATAYPDDNCFICEQPLQLGKRVQCPACGIIREPLQGQENRPLTGQKQAPLPTQY